MGNTTTNSYKQFNLRETVVNEAAPPYYVEKVRCSTDVVGFLREIWTDETFRESFYAVYLDQDNNIQGYKLLAQGTASSVVVPVNFLFTAALLIPRCTGIILAHNHPSGKMEPSTADRVLTDDIKTASKILGFRLLDHLIINDTSHFSFGENGLI